MTVTQLVLLHTIFGTLAALSASLFKEHLAANIEILLAQMLLLELVGFLLSGRQGKLGSFLLDSHRIGFIRLLINFNALVGPQLHVLLIAAAHTVRETCTREHLGLGSLTALGGIG